MNLYKLLLIQLYFDWLFICTVVFTMHFLWHHLASEINPCKTFPITNFFLPVEPYFAGDGKWTLYPELPKSIAFSPDENLQFHALLSSIGTGFLLVLATYKNVQVRIVELSITDHNEYRIEWHFAKSCEQRLWNPPSWMEAESAQP